MPKPKHPTHGPAGPSGRMGPHARTPGLSPLLALMLMVPAGAATAAAPPAAGHAVPAAPVTPVPAMPARPAPGTVPPVPPPAGPLDTPSPIVAHPDKVLVETVALAGRRLVAGGLNGLLMLSDDDGASWRQVRLPVSASLTAIRFIDAHTGWAVGHFGVVLRTSDAGEHWTLVQDGVRAAAGVLTAAQTLNATETARNKAIEAAEVLVRTDPSRPFLLIQTEGADTIRLIGAGTLSIESLDGGNHWLPWSNAIENPNGFVPDGIAERNGVLVAAGAHGLLLAGKPDTGLRALKSPYDGRFFGIVAGDRYGIVLFGQQGHAFVSKDLGPGPASPQQPAWRQIDNPSPTALTAGLVRQDGEVLLGDASGATWRIEGKPDDPRLVPAGPQAPFPILALAEAADRSLILAGTGGVIRVAPETHADAAASP